MDGLQRREQTIFHRPVRVTLQQRSTARCDHTNRLSAAHSEPVSAARQLDDGIRRRPTRFLASWAAAPLLCPADDVTACRTRKGLARRPWINSELTRKSGDARHVVDVIKSLVCSSPTGFYFRGRRRESRRGGLLCLYTQTHYTHIGKYCRPHSCPTVWNSSPRQLRDTLLV